MKKFGEACDDARPISPVKIGGTLIPRLNSLFAPKFSLFRQKNSLFRCVGNLAASH
jgi:hypothetical protein